MLVSWIMYAIWTASLVGAVYSIANALKTEHPLSANR
jgi:hypothetical protein